MKHPSPITIPLCLAFALPVVGVNAAQVGKIDYVPGNTYQTENPYTNETDSAYFLLPPKDYPIIPSAKEWDTLTTLLARVEADYNSTASGRMKLHGGKPTSSYSTNDVTGIIQRVDTYPDGYIHTHQGRKLALPSIAMQAKGKAAKRTAQQMRESRTASLKEQVAALNAAIAEYEAEPTKEGRMDYAKALIERESKQRMILRLEHQQTNTMTQVITPQKDAAR